MSEKLISRRGFLELGVGAFVTERLFSAEIKEGTSWVEGLKEMKVLAQTRKVEYGQNYVVLDEVGKWDNGSQEGGRRQITLDNSDAFVRIMRYAYERPRAKLEICKLHTHPNDIYKNVPPSLIDTKKPHHGDVSTLISDINFLKSIEKDAYSWGLERGHHFNISFSEDMRGMAFDPRGIWSYRLNTGHPMIKKLSQAQEGLSAETYEQAIRANLKTIEVIGQKISAFMKNPAPRKIDLAELIQAYASIGVHLEFHDYNVLEKNLPPGKLVPKRYHNQTDLTQH